MRTWLWQTKQTLRDWWESRRWPRRPETINIEITAACDARCIHCPRLDMDRPMKPMAPVLFRKLVLEAAALGVRGLCPNGYGEICTLPMPVLEEYFGVIAKADHEFRILINTNGNRMTEDRAELFIRSGVYLINVTIDGATAETAESIRKNLKFDRIDVLVRRLIEMRNKAGKRFPMVRVGMVAMAQTVPEWGTVQRPVARRGRLHRTRRILEPTVEADFIGLGGFLEPTVERRAGPDDSTRYPDDATDTGIGGPCLTAATRARGERRVLPFRDLNIWADGKAVVCCEDWNEELVVGDLNTQSLKEIWHSPRLMEVRRMHLAKRGHEISLCAKCNNWQPPSRSARLWAQ